jgi:DNA-binding CsgD family transcriptional regulator
MQAAPSESCERCDRSLIHPVVTACRRGRKAALRAIDGVRTLGREVAAEWEEAGAKAKGRKLAARPPASRRRVAGPACPLHDVRLISPGGGVWSCPKSHDPIHYRGAADVPGQRLGVRRSGIRRGQALQLLPGVEARTVRGIEPDRALERRQTYIQVVSARSALSIEDAEVLLFLIDGVKPRKIAAERGLTPRQAKTVIERIRRRLHPCGHDIRANEAARDDEMQARAVLPKGDGPDEDEREMRSDDFLD